MKRPNNPDPYCGLSNDRERRHALTVREVCGVLRRALTVAGLVVTAVYLPAASGKIETAIRALR